MRHWPLAALLPVVAFVLAACGEAAAPERTASPESDIAVAPGAPTFGESARDASVSSTAPAAAKDAPAPAVPALASALDRKVIFNATLSLAVNDVGAAFQQASRVAAGLGGFVDKSSYSSPAGSVETRTASLTLRVPAARTQDALAALRQIDGARVTAESSRSSEVTEQYTDLQSRQRNLERTEQTYLGLLQQAKTVQDILTINDRLDGVRAQIEQIQGRLKMLDALSEMATVDLSLALPAAARASTGGPTGVGEAFVAALDWSADALRYLAAAGVVGVVAVVWLAIPAAVLILGVRFLRRHRSPSSAGGPA
ncbi:MAG: DUF4349 domain-containing protein [Dehalococcoidia bacterium]|nr:DUF4349 domain-containing protein [Dehalococcoidia bacterium]